MSDPPNKDSALLKAVIERLSNPDRLDMTLEVITPRMWIPLFTLALLLLLALAWGLFARIPESMTCSAVVTPSHEISLPRALSGAPVKTGVFPEASGVSSGGFFAVAEIPADKGKVVRSGMAVRVISDADNRGAFRGISGKVLSVAPLGVTGDSSAVRSGAAIAGDHRFIPVHIAFYPSTAGGVRAGQREPFVAPSTGTSIPIHIILRERAPISLFLPSW